MKKMRYGAKGQAALEFIMTYGWAILVVLVAIGALAYFGVLSPGKLLPNKCILQSGLACLDFRVTETAVTASIQNSLGFDLQQVNFSATGCTNTGPGVLLPNGQRTTLVATCTGISGTKYNGDLNVSYIVIDTGISHVNVGSLTAAIG